MLPRIDPVPRSATTITSNPAVATAVAAMVTRLSRSRRTTRPRTAANSGVTEARNAALAAVVFLSAYTKHNEAPSSAALAAIIEAPEV